MYFVKAQLSRGGAYVLSKDTAKDTLATVRQLKLQGYEVTVHTEFGKTVPEAELSELASNNSENESRANQNSSKL